MATPATPRVTTEWPTVSVVIPSRDRRELLGRVLESLARQTYPSERTEAVVVLDGSTDGSAELVRSLPLPYAVRLVERPKSGIGATRNAGVEVSTGDVVLFLDDDIVPEQPCLSVHAAAHAAAAGEQVALGYCPPVTDGSWWSLELRSWWEDHYRRKLEPNHRWTYMDFVTGNSSLPRSLLEELGGFDEAFTARHEDWELAVRLLERGVRLSYDPGTRAAHHLDTSLQGAVARQREEARETCSWPASTRAS